MLPTLTGDVGTVLFDVMNPFSQCSCFVIFSSGDLSNPFIEDDTPESTSEDLTSEERLQSQSSSSENESDTSDLNSEEPDESESLDDGNDDRYRSFQSFSKKIELFKFISLIQKRNFVLF